MASERWKDLGLWLGRLIRRNVITLICVAMFVITLRVKWLLGVLPLWGVVIAAVFALIHFTGSRLWRFVGTLPKVRRRAQRLESATA